MYTNGFNYDAILPVLKGRLGWSSNPGTARNFESFHALCTEKNLRDVQPTASITDSAFEDYKEQLESDIIMRCLSAVFPRPEYIEQVLLHNRIENSATDPIANGQGFCGVKLRIAPDFQISEQVRSVTLLFDGAATFNLYLFKHGTPAPLYKQSVTTIAGTPTLISLDDWIISYAKEQTTNYYLGYFQADLGAVRAIRYQAHKVQTKCFAADCLEARKTGAERIDQDQVQYGYTPYGLNAEVHAFRDYTYRILTAPHLFDEAIGLSMVAFVLEQIVCSTRSNETERILNEGLDKIQLNYYLYGAAPLTGVARTEGLQDRIARRLQDIRKGFNPEPRAQTVSVC
jgi:hypothetical protein